MDSCAFSVGCSDTRALRTTASPASGVEPRRAPRELTAAARREMLLLVHADFALFHNPDENARGDDGDVEHC